MELSKLNIVFNSLIFFGTQLYNKNKKILTFLPLMNNSATIGLRYLL